MIIQNKLFILSIIIIIYHTLHYLFKYFIITTRITIIYYKYNKSISKDMDMGLICYYYNLILINIIFLSY